MALSYNLCVPNEKLPLARQNTCHKNTPINITHAKPRLLQNSSFNISQVVAKC